MPYIDPADVTSPHARLSKLIPIKDTGEDGWSAALLDWDNRPRLGLRWNGGGDGKPHPGNPQSRGLPTWFVVPDEVASETLRSVVAAGLGGGRIDQSEASACTHAFADSLEVAEIAAAGDGLQRKVEAIVMGMKERGLI